MGTIVGVCLCSFSLEENEWTFEATESYSMMNQLRKNEGDIKSCGE